MVVIDITRVFGDQRVSMNWTSQEQLNATGVASDQETSSSRLMDGNMCVCVLTLDVSNSIGQEEPTRLQQPLLEKRSSRNEPSCSVLCDRILFQASPVKRLLCCLFWVCSSTQATVVYAVCGGPVSGRRSGRGNL